MLRVDAEKCSGCRICTKICPFGAMAVVDDLARALENCVLCGACVNACRENAITLEKKQVPLEQLAAYAGVLIWGECDDCGGRMVPRKVVLELLARGRDLADRRAQQLVVVVLTDQRPVDFDSLFANGADKIVLCRHKLLDRYETDSFTNVISAVICKHKPEIFLLGATPNGRDLAPRIAARLRLGLTADCTGLDIDSEGRLVQTRPAFGGNIMASIVTPFTRPQMATVRPNVFQLGGCDGLRSGVIEEFEVVLTKAAIRTRLVAEERVETGAQESIENARIIVSAGRGCRQRENLGVVGELARRLRGIMAGSRAIVELGWIPHTLQVGQSGTTVCPDLYLAVGISGAVQHLVGMSSSKTVVAVNNDPEAPIFKVADFGIVGDAMEILPLLVKRLKEEQIFDDTCVLT